MRAVLIDSGPLAAMLDHDDPSHEPTLAALRGVQGELRTIWPALTEAAHLLRRKSPSYTQKLLEIVESGAIKISPLGPDDAPRIRAILKRFGDQPLDLADAALTRVAERDEPDVIVTLDERDFRVVERAYKGRFKIVVPR